MAEDGFFGTQAYPHHSRWFVGRFVAVTGLDFLAHQFFRRFLSFTLPLRRKSGTRPRTHWEPVTQAEVLVLERE